MNMVIKMKDDMKIEFTDRYKANGIPYPDPKTCCPECEGMGVNPFYMKKYDKELQEGIAKGEYVAEQFPDMEKFGEPYLSMYLAAEKEHPSRDGTHFLKCLDCGGTGKIIQ